ncbi:hypothetical protein [Paenibacillus popilliae]|nr:hypothetical protein [Paenibacillus sp. SDF0028]
MWSIREQQLDAARSNTYIYSMQMDGQLIEVNFLLLAQTLLTMMMPAASL